MPGFLKLGTIKGDSRYEGFVDQIEIQSLAYGIDVAGGTSSGGMQEISKPVLPHVVLTKSADSSSVPLLQAAGLATITPLATVTLARQSEKLIPFAYLTIELRNARVASVNSSWGGELPLENVTLAFDQIRWTSALGTTKATWGWDVALGKGV